MFNCEDHGIELERAGGGSMFSMGLDHSALLSTLVLHGSPWYVDDDRGADLPVPAVCCKGVSGGLSN